MNGGKRDKETKNDKYFGFLVRSWQNPKQDIPPHRF